jgi:D-lactate dehydrogenase (quinone)
MTKATTEVGIDAARHDAARGNARFLDELRTIVGRRYVLTSPERTRRYRTGFRFGTGPALAVVRPGSLVEQWGVLRACTAANKIIIMQAANTGITGGSTSDGGDYDREIVIVSAPHGQDRPHQRRTSGGLPSRRHSLQLEKALKPLGREPHSVIGSSCIGASVLGGVCNNSGGALIHRGPAYTQMTLFARIDDAGEVQLVNHLGVRLGKDPQTILDRLDRDAPKRISSTTRTVSPPITITPKMSATSTPIRPDASMPIRSACSRPPAAPAR